MEFRAESPEGMLSLGERLGRVLAPGDVVGLVGDLGAGKTVLARGVARGAGVPPEVLVTSPSFTLVNEYRGGRLPIFHVDLYRLEEPDELEEIGLYECYRSEGATLVEWFHRFAEAAPREYLRVVIRFEDARVRRLEVEPVGASAERLLSRWKEEG